MDIVNYTVKLRNKKISGKYTNPVQSILNIKNGKGSIKLQAVLLVTKIKTDKLASTKTCQIEITGSICSTIGTGG